MVYLIDAISLGALYALVTLGVALVFGVMRMVNFAHGEIIMLAGYSVAVLGTISWPFLVVGILVTAVLAAVITERVAFRGVRNADESTLLITSFAVSYGLQQLVVVIRGSRPVGVNPFPWLSSSVDIGGNQVSVLSLVTIAAGLAFGAGLVFFLTRTRTGAQLRAAAEDFTMARLVGIRANRVIAVAFALSGLLAGVASICVVSQSGSLTPNLGVEVALLGFVATVVGGLGSLAGAAIGGFLLGAVSVAWQVVLPVELRSFREALLFLTVILLLLFRPQGLMGHAKNGERV